MLLIEKGQKYFVLKMASELTLTSSHIVQEEIVTWKIIQNLYESEEGKREEVHHREKLSQLTKQIVGELLLELPLSFLNVIVNDTEIQVQKGKEVG